MNFCDWIDGALMPVISEYKEWSLEGFEGVLTREIKECFIQSSIGGFGVVTTLSGGIDSSFCVSRLEEFATLIKTIVHTFTIGGSVSHPDVLYARMVSDFFHTVHTEIIPSNAEIKLAKKRLAKLRPTEKITKGDIAVFLTYKAIADKGFKFCIAHDGIDELLGGYWKHRDVESERERENVFQRFWLELIPRHLVPLEKIARYFGIKVFFPYLHPRVVEYISHIPVSERTNFITSKIPLRKIARKYLQKEVIERQKMGFCSALDK